MSGGVRVRRSVLNVAKDPKECDLLMKAFEGVANLDYQDPNSFFMIGGYHGQPFRGPGAQPPTNPQEVWWGGYCAHGNVLFPVWHRAYMYALETALRSIDGCGSVTLPYWDETDEYSLAHGVPDVLTQVNYTFQDGRTIPNPLRSFTFPVAMKDESGGNPSYSKPQGYPTVRYPLSGMVDNPQQAAATKRHNAQFPDPELNNKILKENVAYWLNHEVVIDNDQGVPTEISSSHMNAQFIQCLDAPNYTVFSNTTSQRKWNSDPKNVKVVSLESPHNGVHLAVGGFDWPGYHASRIPGANGDMGENNTAGLDPIFFFHHCNIDRVFQLWQERHGATEKLEVIPGYAGTNTADNGTNPAADQEWNQKLDMSSPLFPFKINGQVPTGAEVTSNKALGVEYEAGSLSHRNRNNNDIVIPHGPRIQVSKVDRSKIGGSFIIAAYADLDGTGVETLVGVEPVLSRWNTEGCMNCQNHIEAQAHFVIPTKKPISFEPVIKPDKEKTHVRIAMITRKLPPSLHAPESRKFVSGFAAAGEPVAQHVDYKVEVLSEHA